MSVALEARTSSNVLRKMYLDRERVCKLVQSVYANVPGTKVVYDTLDDSTNASPASATIDGDNRCTQG